MAHVACLMVSLPAGERFAFLRNSVADWRRQTHAERSLVIVLDPRAGEARARVRTFVAELGDPSIRLVEPEGEPSLGALRNLSLAEAGADIVCQWDDDDRSHPARLAAQLDALARGDGEAVYLQDVMQHFPREGAMAWTNWKATPAGGHPGTLMARRAPALRYPETGEEARRGEDLAVAKALIARGAVGYVAEKPWLYVYASHGANTWSEGHHRMLADELSISRGLLRRREKEVREGLAPFGFAPGAIEVRGRNGPAFTL
ncbi:glycosyltransferase [Methylocella sp.]|uniref:glycosyltransferase n=1 Tax=Methylocella sp. TaxID=1978226 RepID=UPI003784527F